MRNRESQKKLIIFYLCTVLLFAALPFSAQAQAGKKPRMEKSVTTKSTAVVKTENVKTVEKMPVGFSGDNIQEIAKAVYPLKNKLGKTQFETESEYFSRIESLTKSTEFKDKTLNDAVVSYSPYLWYDINTKEYIVYIGDIEVIPGALDSKRLQDAGLILLIKQDDPNVRAIFANVGGANIKIPMKPAEAQAAQKEIRIAVYGTPVNSLATNLFDFFIKKVVVFNETTGEIYKTVQGKDIKYSKYVFKP